MIVTALAVFWAWEFVLVLLPWPVPAPVQPAVVAGLAYGAGYLPPAVVLAGAVAGAVALLHTLLRHYQPPEPAVATRALRGLGNRVPNLP